MSTQATIDTKAAQSHELLQMLLNLSAEEITNLRWLLYYAEILKRNGREKDKGTPVGASQRQRRFIDLCRKYNLKYKQWYDAILAATLIENGIHVLSTMNEAVICL